MTPEEIIQRVHAKLGAACEVSQGMVTAVVPPARWLAALAFARDDLDCDFFDWLSAVDEMDAGLAVVVHVYSLGGRHHLLLRTVLTPGSLAVPTARTLIPDGEYSIWSSRESYEAAAVLMEMLEAAKESP